MVPRLVDATLAQDPVTELRRRTCAGLRGRVLEIGFGSGLNVGCLPPAVEAVDAVEPSDVGWSRSAVRRGASAVPIRRTGTDGQRLAAGAASYDAVLVTFTLCTIPDAAAAAAEVRRVLRPGGTCCFLEHGLAPQPRVAAWQRRLEPTQRTVVGGCHLTRDPPALLTAAGLTLAELDQSYLPGPAAGRPWSYLSLGRAVLG